MKLKFGLPFIFFSLVSFNSLGFDISDMNIKCNFDGEKENNKLVFRKMKTFKFKVDCKSQPAGQITPSLTFSRGLIEYLVSYPNEYKETYKPKKLVSKNSKETILNSFDKILGFENTQLQLNGYCDSRSRGSFINFSKVKDNQILNAIAFFSKISPGLTCVDSENSDISERVFDNNRDRTSKKYIEGTNSSDEKSNSLRQK